MALLKRNIDLILILAIGFALRFSVSITHSYTNDELSAINRLRYDSFSELLEKGVKQGDMHPAGVQVFEKIWSSLFGTSELALRFPFVLCGTASIFMIFLLGLKWFNRSTGIYAAAILSVLYFPIIQSELARPYSPGLLIVLLAAWFFHKVLFCEVKKYKNAIFLGLSFAAGMYTHYFLFLFLIFIGFTGLLFLKKDNIRYYATAVLIASVIYLPHISVTWYHLNVGGLGWLGAPSPYFLIDFVKFAFNDSQLILLLANLLVLLFIIQRNHTNSLKSKYLILSAVWFFGIYGIAHILSLISTPILKMPVMLFAFPFLILIIAYFISSIKWKYFVLAAILVTGTYSTLKEKELFGIKHMGFKNTAKHLVDWNQKYGDENIYTLYNLSNPDYMNFYATQLGDTVHFDRDLIEFGDSPEIRNELRNRTEELCIVGYSERLTLPQVFETVREFYPNIREYYTYENSAVFLMSKEDPGAKSPASHIFSGMDLFELNDKQWKINPQFIRDSIPEKKSYLLNIENKYGPAFSFSRWDIDKLGHSYLKVKINATCAKNIQLTATLTANRNGMPLENNGELFWMGYDLEEMILTTCDSITNTGHGYWAFEIPDFIQKEDELIISVYSRNGVPIEITDFEIWRIANIWN